jgi:hypothetical protein
VRLNPDDLSRPVLETQEGLRKWSWLNVVREVEQSEVRAPPQSSTEGDPDRSSAQLKTIVDPKPAKWGG